MLSSQSREFHNFFSQLIVAATKLMVLADFFCEIIFAKYELKFSYFFENFFVRWKPFSLFVPYFLIIQ